MPVCCQFIHWEVTYSVLPIALGPKFLLALKRQQPQRLAEIRPNRFPFFASQVKCSSFTPWKHIEFLRETLRLFQRCASPWQWTTIWNLHLAIYKARTWRWSSHYLKINVVHFNRISSFVRITLRVYPILLDARRRCVSDGLSCWDLNIRFDFKSQLLEVAVNDWIMDVQSFTIFKILLCRFNYKNA